jgi:YggT family protein
MIVLHNIIITILDIYRWVLIGYILMSWVPNIRETTFGQFIGTLAEPYLAPFRKIIPPLGMIDISPIVAIIALGFAQTGVSALFSMLL